MVIGIRGAGFWRSDMVVWFKVILAVLSGALILGGLFTPAVRINDGQLLPLFEIGLALIGSPATPVQIPPGLKALGNELLGGMGAVLLGGVGIIVLAVFKWLRSTLFFSVVAAPGAGLLMVRLMGAEGVVIEVPEAWGWALLVAGALLALLVGVFALFGSGEAPKPKRTAKTFDRSRVEPVVTNPRRDAPRQATPPPAPTSSGDPATVHAAAGALPPPPPPPTAPVGAPDRPKPKPAAGRPPAGARPPARPQRIPPPAPPMHGDSEATTGHKRAITPEGPTESGGWVLSGFDTNGMAVRLTLTDSELKRSSDGLVVGRSTTQANLTIRDDSVSRKHAVLAVGSPLSVQDLGSSNGTRVNGADLGPNEVVSLDQGAEIEFGAVRLTLTRT